MVEYVMKCNGRENNACNIKNIKQSACKNKTYGKHGDHKLI